MKRNNTARIALMGLCLIAPVFGQIIIDWTEIPNEANTRWSKNIAYEATVSLGSSGGPQTWTFTTQPMGPDSCVNLIKSCWQTPYWDTFPSANLCYASIEEGDTAYLYMHLAPGYLANLGLVGQDSGDVYTQKYIPPDTNDLPEQFGDLRHYSTLWFVIIDASTYVRYQKRGLEYINAYGTVNIPCGSFPCLRYVIWDTLFSTVYYNNNPVFYDTVNRIGHQFVAENRSGVVCVFSHANETNPYFTSAAVLERLTNYTNIEEISAGQQPDAAITCRPNPFTSRTVISIGQKAKSIELEIYDVTGKPVRTILPADYSLVWNGNDQNGHAVPPGVYFVRMGNGGSGAVTEKIIKLE